MKELYPLLKGVSRSFYLSLRILPGALAPRIAVAYLCARASDTVADTKVASRVRRIEILRRLRQGNMSPVREVSQDQDLPAERELLARIDEIVSIKQSFSTTDQALIDKLLDTIIGGQIFDLERFPDEEQGGITALSDDQELDRYTFMVAGCVGEFWTRICALHLPGLASWDVEKASILGIRFGKGLQLVNVLRDIPQDLRMGRCYLPVKDPGALLDPAAFPAIQNEYRRWLDLAVDHLEAGWRYTLSIPASERRLRLACIWPNWLGLGTIALLRDANPLDPRKRVMVPQSRTNWLLAQSLALCWSDGLLERAFQARLKQARQDMA